MWRNNRIIFNLKDSSAGSMFCIYIRLQTQIYILYENYWKHWKLPLPLDKVVKQKLIPALFNDFQISEELRSLIALPRKLGGMGIISPIEIANEEYVNSRELTKKLTNLFILYNKNTAAQYLKMK